MSTYSFYSQKKIDNKVTATIHSAYALRGLKCTALLRLMVGC